MKTKTFFLAAIAATVILTSCDNNDGVDNSNRVALSVISGIATETTQTRVTGTSWDAGDAIGIFQLQGSNTLNTNSKYVSSTGTSAFSPATLGETIYFPIDASTSSDFIAYHPYKTGQTVFDYAVTVSDQSNQATIDLLVADKVTGKDKNAPAVAFNFKHRLSKVSLTIAAGNGIAPSDLEGIVITITGQQTAATYNINTFTLTPSGAVQEITLKTAGDGLSSEAIILPAAATTGRQLIFTLKTLNEPFIWDIPNDKAFDSGVKYNYSITLNRTSIEVTSTITDWIDGNGDGENGSAE